MIAGVAQVRPICVTTFPSLRAHPAKTEKIETLNHSGWINLYVRLHVYIRLCEKLIVSKQSEKKKKFQVFT